VGLRVLSAELFRRYSGASGGCPRCHLVARDRRTVLFDLALDCPPFFFHANQTHCTGCHPSSPLVRFNLALHHVNIYSNFFCRLDGLMMGALLAVLIHSEAFVPLEHVKLAWVSLFLASSLAILAENRQIQWITFSMTSWASASLIYLSLFSQWKWIQSIFKNRFLTYTGVISYGLYLLHKIPLDVIKATHFKRYSFFCILMAFVFSYLLAAISWTILEKPFLKLKRFVDSRPVARLSSNPPTMQVST